MSHSPRAWSLHCTVLLVLTTLILPLQRNALSFPFTLCIQGCWPLRTASLGAPWSPSFQLDRVKWKAWRKIPQVLSSMAAVCLSEDLNLDLPGHWSKPSPLLLLDSQSFNTACWLLSPAHTLVVCYSLNFLLPPLSEPSLFCSDNYWSPASLIILRVKTLGWLPSLLAAERKLMVISQSMLVSAVAGTVLPTREENLEPRFLKPWIFTTLPLIQRKVDSIFSAFPIPHKVEGSQFRSDAQVDCAGYYWGQWKIWLKTKHSKN